MNPAEPALILDLIEAFRRSKTMFAAVKLGVFELLQTAPLTSAAIAAGIFTDTAATQRLCYACVSLGLLEEHGGQFSNTAVSSAYLCRNSNTSMTGYITYSNDVLMNLWGNLEDAVREGTHRWNQSFGFSGPLFDSFFPSDDAMRTFIMGMHGFGTLSSPAVAQAFDLSGFKTVVDLGGATGHLTIALCERYNQLRGVVFDFARVLRVADEQIAQSSARDRITCMAGDFFRDDLPVADLYVMGRILHDWNDAKVNELIRKSFNALPSGGALLLAEKLLDENHHGPASAQMQSLNMLICTEGRERSFAEYSESLNRAGFTKVEFVRTGKPVDAILARKP